MQTIGQKLAAYKARRTHVADIKEPLVRALWWREWEMRNAEIMRDCGGSGAFSELRDAAEREVEIARAARREILLRRDAMRTWAASPLSRVRAVA